MKELIVRGIDIKYQAFDENDYKLNKVSRFTHIYYAHPYSSFERGTNEKQNSLVRRFFKKSTSFKSVPSLAVQRVMEWINNLSRKIFGYNSSASLFNDFLSFCDKCPI